MLASLAAATLILDACAADADDDGVDPVASVDPMESRCWSIWAHSLRKSATLSSDMSFSQPFFSITDNLV